MLKPEVGQVKSELKKKKSPKIFSVGLIKLTILSHCLTSVDTSSTIPIQDVRIAPQFDPAPGAISPGLADVTVWPAWQSGSIFSCHWSRGAHVMLKKRKTIRFGVTKASYHPCTPNGALRFHAPVRCRGFHTK